MKRALLDTVGLLAVWDEDDQWHTAAEQAWACLAQQGAILHTTTHILLECGNAAARRPYRLEVDHLREWLEEAGTLIWPEKEDWSTAWAAYRRGDAGGAGIVDHVSFAVMRRLGIDDAFSNDRHFRAAGFNVLF